MAIASMKEIRGTMMRPEPKVSSMSFAETVSLPVLIEKYGAWKRRKLKDYKYIWPLDR